MPRALVHRAAHDPRLGSWLALGALGLLAWGVLAVWTPSDDPRWSVCVVQRLTHHDCATCGMTRAFAALARGDVAGALARHPLALPLAAEAVLLWLGAPLAGWRPARWLATHRDSVLVANAAALLGVWLVRLTG